MAYGKANIDTIQSSTAGTPPQFNDGNGTQTGTLCRAWVNFNGTGTVAIRASFNVSSITDNGTGDYTINFTNAMPDANYSVASQGNTASGYLIRGADDFTARTTALFRIATYTLVGSQQDSSIVNVSVFR